MQILVGQYVILMNEIKIIKNHKLPSIIIITYKGIRKLVGTEAIAANNI